MIDLGSIAGLFARGHELHAYCRHCDRWRVLDLAAVVKVAKQHKVLTVIDATLATPYNIKPLEMGVDIVIHSATKYLGGHNDLLAGVALGNDELLNDLYRMQRMFGSTPGPLTCFLLERGLKTFGLRMEHHNRAGLAIARLLEAHPKIEKVWYPALERASVHGTGTRLNARLKWSMLQQRAYGETAKRRPMTNEDAFDTRRPRRQAVATRASVTMSRT